MRWREGCRECSGGAEEGMKKGKTKGGSGKGGREREDCACVCMHVSRPLVSGVRPLTLWGCWVISGRVDSVELTC